MTRKLLFNGLDPHAIALEACMDGFTLPNKTRVEQSFFKEIGSALIQLQGFRIVPYASNEHRIDDHRYT
jgi:hypothetical protein